MLSAFGRKGREKARTASANRQMTNSAMAEANGQRRKRTEARAMVVKFESDQPTEIWQASPSPSPTPSEKEKRRELELRLLMHKWSAECERPADGDSSDDDTGTSCSGRRSDCSASTCSSSSTSSLDEGVLAAHERRRRRKRRPRLPPTGPAQPRRSLSSSSTTTDSGADENKAVSHPQTTASDLTQSQTSSWPSNAQVTCPNGATFLTPMSTPRLMYPSPQITHVRPAHAQPYGPLVLPSPYPSPAVASARKPVHSHQHGGKSCGEARRPLVRLVGDYLPPLDWQKQYRVLGCEAGSYAIVEKQPPRTPRDEASAVASWLLVRKWCPGHWAATGDVGFVPRHLCRQLTDHEVIQVREAASSPAAAATPSAAAATAASSQNPAWPYSSFPSPAVSSASPYNSIHVENRTQVKEPVASTTSQVTPSSVFGSGGSLTFGSEHEDRDSGRGPSSGSEWSSARGGSSNGALDTVLDEPDRQSTRLSQSSWSKADDEPFWRHSESTSESPPVLPPPMEPLKGDLTPRLVERLNSMTLTEADSTAAKDEAGEAVVISATVNPAEWKPYETMIQLGHDTMEKFTLV